MEQSSWKQVAFHIKPLPDSSPLTRSDESESWNPAIQEGSSPPLHNQGWPCQSDSHTPENEILKARIANLENYCLNSAALCYISNLNAIHPM